MTTPSSRTSTVAPPSHVPSSSVLRQLLEEIKGSDTPTILRNSCTPNYTLRSPPGLEKTRVTPTVWVGGTSIAQEAREKLRAADEARYCKPVDTVSDGISDTRTEEDKPRKAGNGGSSQSPIKKVIFSQASVKVSSKDGGAEDDSYLKGQMPCPRSKPSILCFSNPANITAASYWCSERFAGMTSPPMFCDVDCDTSSTPSPTDPPTSAISTDSTDRTTITSARSSPPSDMSKHSPNKRAQDFATSPEQLTKKMRTNANSMHTDRRHTQPEIGYFPTTWSSTGGDNRCLIRNSTFVERAPATQKVIGMAMAVSEAELSSFRPGVTDCQGLPLATKTTIRDSPRRSMAEQPRSPTPPETPIYARSLHLVDTEISIFKKSHGDEWEEYPLCLYCFRSHGDFNRIFEHGYEVCGRNEALDNHYWEPYGDAAH